MLPRARDGARHEVLDDKRHDRGTWSCQSPPALVGQVLLCYWGLSASCKGAKRNFSFKAQFQDKNFTLKNRNQLLMQMNKQSQANHSTVNPPQKRAARQATDASSASAFERAPGRALRGGRAGVVRPRATSHVGRSRGTRLPTPRLHVLRGRGFRLSGTMSGEQLRSLIVGVCLVFLFFKKLPTVFQSDRATAPRPPPCVSDPPLEALAGLFTSLLPTVAPRR